jgi:hypothetical protein
VTKSQILTKETNVPVATVSHLNIEGFNSIGMAKLPSVLNPFTIRGGVPMDKVMLKVSGLVLVTSTLVGLMGGLLVAPRSGAQTRKKIHKTYGGIKDRVTHEVHDLKGSVGNMVRLKKPMEIIG